jgi:hypothetical protein
MISKSKKKLFIIIFIILGMLLAGSKQLSTITDLDAAKKFCELNISKKD